MPRWTTKQWKEQLRFLLGCQLAAVQGAVSATSLLYAASTICRALGRACSLKPICLQLCASAIPSCHSTIAAASGRIARAPWTAATVAPERSTLDSRYYPDTSRPPASTPPSFGHRWRSRPPRRRAIPWSSTSQRAQKMPRSSLRSSAEGWLGRRFGSSAVTVGDSEGWLGWGVRKQFSELVGSLAEVLGWVIGSCAEGLLGWGDCKLC